MNITLGDGAPAVAGLATSQGTSGVSSLKNDFNPSAPSFEPGSGSHPVPMGTTAQEYVPSLSDYIPSAQIKAADHGEANASDLDCHRFPSICNGLIVVGGSVVVLTCDTQAMHKFYDGRRLSSFSGIHRNPPKHLWINIMTGTRLPSIHQVIAWICDMLSGFIGCMKHVGVSIVRHGDFVSSEFVIPDFKYDSFQPLRTFIMDIVRIFPADTKFTWGCSEEHELTLSKHFLSQAVPAIQEALADYPDKGIRAYSKAIEGSILKSIADAHGDGKGRNFTLDIQDGVLGYNTGDSTLGLITDRPNLTSCTSSLNPGAKEFVPMDRSKSPPRRPSMGWSAPDDMSNTLYKQMANANHKYNHDSRNDIWGQLYYDPLPYPGNGTYSPKGRGAFIGTPVSHHYPPKDRNSYTHSRASSATAPYNGATNEPHNQTASRANLIGLFQTLSPQTQRNYDGMTGMYQAPQAQPAYTNVVYQGPQVQPHYPNTMCLGPQAQPASYNFGFPTSQVGPAYSLFAGNVNHYPTFSSAENAKSPPLYTPSMASMNSVNGMKPINSKNGINRNGFNNSGSMNGNGFYNNGHKKGKGKHLRRKFNKPKQNAFQPPSHPRFPVSAPLQHTALAPSTPKPTTPTYAQIASHGHGNYDSNAAGPDAFNGIVKATMSGDPVGGKNSDNSGGTNCGMNGHHGSLDNSDGGANVGMNGGPVGSINSLSDAYSKNNNSDNYSKDSDADACGETKLVEW
ncbi:hypothetical protein CC78DRAFT_114054 [Lojkania enalia]|uniref:Uncharacterized protein n=1 Tax=Lojkania enalia TaxID=147567 RepID=A0A9P4MYG1_9PLEO|nr:hypothetical protein CC78DRAFT_114054 [Didymosphaeria enalia]